MEQMVYSTLAMKVGSWGETGRAGALSQHLSTPLPKAPGGDSQGEGRGTRQVLVPDPSQEARSPCSPKTQAQPLPNDLFLANIPSRSQPVPSPPTRSAEASDTELYRWLPSGLPKTGTGAHPQGSGSQTPLPTVRNGDGQLCVFMDTHCLKNGSSSKGGAQGS